jgi:hypothetical protein
MVAARALRLAAAASLAARRARSDSESFEPPEGAFVRITAASNGMCAIRRDGSLVCWGDNPLAVPDDW